MPAPTTNFSISQSTIPQYLRAFHAAVKLTMGLVALFGTGCLLAQPQPSNPKNLFTNLGFLEGEWSAVTPGVTGAPNVTGAYSFRRELGGRVLARHSTSASCKAPTDFDCDHGDLLYIYSEGPGPLLKAIYFDNEGHVIHYNVSTPTSTSAIFLSESSDQRPQFRLTYDLNGKMMSGKFQVKAPGEHEWRSYLEWSGPRK